ncbi:mycothiol transferase [Sphaerisporangium aureirubrum]|uniref:DUF664 domain-containing protein n=1 Tax=Sphaerisporangium aureirubrum TaxID=1544736 RepID=A0ABW1NGN5_9ACTN
MDDSEKNALLMFLEAQRASVLAIVDGLDDKALTTAVLPSGWTPLGEVLAATPLSAPPRGHHPPPLGDEITDLRRIVLHMIEETARHAGHLARELLDGKTGLGPR